MFCHSSLALHPHTTGQRILQNFESKNILLTAPIKLGHDLGFWNVLLKHPKDNIDYTTWRENSTKFWMQKYPTAFDKLEQ